MKFNFNVDNTFDVGIDRLASILGYERGDGISVTASQGERIGVSLKNGAATIYYRDKAQFFRGLGVLVENAKKSDKFDITEDTFFTTLSAMIDSSRCGVPTLKTVKGIIDYLAVMGYNMIMLYTEDVIKLENRPYFGYMRGRYTVEDLKEIDDYAYEYGIEVIPCLECYGHMEKYLREIQGSGQSADRNRNRQIKSPEACAPGPTRTLPYHSIPSQTQGCLLTGFSLFAIRVRVPVF